MIIGRDLDESDRLIKVIRRAVGWSLLLVLGLAVAGGVFVARRVLKRVDAMTKSARSIMEGDFTQRLAMAGTGDELDRVAKSLNAMLDRIAELMAGLREVSDNIAHDLKTPLTRLRNSAEDAALDGVIEEADGLIKIFNALLMIARAEAGAMRDNTAPLDAGDIARDVAELYEPFAEEAGVTLKVQINGPLPVHGTRELISQAMANLIDNAIKYSSSENAEGSDRSVTIEGRREGNVIKLIVADRGPGIPDADRNRAIERFVRLESSRTRPGSGLGLSLVAAVARLHSGSLILEDNAPGLRAVLTLPVEPKSA
jgi:signal transduction histidine kinase